MKPTPMPMKPGNGQPTQTAGAARFEVIGAWPDFFRFCQELGYGEIERLRIQDGVPVLAEITTRKVKFGS